MYALVIFTLSCIHGKWAGTQRIVRVGGVPVNVHYKVRIYKESTVYMSPRRNWNSPNPSLASECAPPPRTGGGGGGILACGKAGHINVNSLTVAVNS